MKFNILNNEWKISSDKSINYRKIYQKLIFYLQSSIVEASIPSSLSSLISSFDAIP